MTMPPVLRRSPSSTETRTSTRSCSIWISSFALEFGAMLASDTRTMVRGYASPPLLAAATKRGSRVTLAGEDELQGSGGAGFQADRDAPVLPGDTARRVL